MTDTEDCRWCGDSAGDAIPGIAICPDCLDKYEIPPRMITGQLDTPVRVAGNPNDTQ